MRSIYKYWSWGIVLIFLIGTSCEDLDELNINPNGVDPENADLNLLMPTIITNLGNNIVDLGFGDLAGVMQHTQKDGWSGDHNNYSWDNTNQSWAGWYGILRNNEEMYRKAVEEEYEFHQGVALVLRAYTAGMITDLWGDAPYEEALKAEESSEFFKPKYSAQKDIYTGVLEDLEEANNLLSKSQSSYSAIEPNQDVLFGGDASKWRKFANSLALRYYMRLSAKEPGMAEQGINKIVSDPDKYPLILSTSDNANVGYVGSSSADSWPTTNEFDPSPSGNYMRLKMCSTFLETLQDLDDPRIRVWAQKIDIPLKLVSGEDVDQVVDGVRELSQDKLDKVEEGGDELNFDPEYVGIPPSHNFPQSFNLKPDLDQGTRNPHVSQLADMYSKSSGSLLQMRLMSASEVHLILSEAALYGWISADAEEEYTAGIQESFKAWNIEDEFSGYTDRAPFNGLESIITQKWIASWSAAAESWFDYRRTGLPELPIGTTAKREALPLRFYYNVDNEVSRNEENANDAIKKLEKTDYNLSDSENSAWSKMWLLQGTGKPY